MAGNDNERLSPETEAIMSMLDREEDLKTDLLDRFLSRNIHDRTIFEETAKDIAFFLEDEVRASASHHFIDISMWADIVMPYICEADYDAIARIWLSGVLESRNPEKTK